MSKWLLIDLKTIEIIATALAWIFISQLQCEKNLLPSEPNYKLEVQVARSEIIFLDIA